MAAILTKNGREREKGKENERQTEKGRQNQKERKW
jgi:hypothetical protein